MREEELSIIDDLIIRYPLLSECRVQIENVCNLLIDVYENNGKLLIAGNGGSAADSGHIVGELMKSFRIKRPIPSWLKEQLCKVDSGRGAALAEKLEVPLEVISLVEHQSLTTAYTNDVEAQSVIAQQLLGYGKEGDAFIGISTSGNSRNIIDAAIVAKAIGVKVIGLTGRNGGKLASIADLAVKVPEVETYKVQELHLPVYHCICLVLESAFFGSLEIHR